MRSLNVHLGAVYVFLYVPVLVLVVLSFNKAGMPTQWSGFSLDWYAKLLANPKILGAAWNSLLVALGATAIATVIGTLMALGAERIRVHPALEALLFAPMIVPDIVLAIALLSFFVGVRMTLGLTSIILAHAVFCIAFVTAVVRARLKNFDWSLIDASRDLGAGPVTTFRRITLPLILPAVVAGALLSFTLSIDEFIIAYFTSGAGPASTTLPMQIYAMLRFGVTPEINALASLMLFLSIVIVLIAQRLDRGRVPGL